MIGFNIDAFDLSANLLATLKLLKFISKYISADECLSIIQNLLINFKLILLINECYFKVTDLYRSRIYL